MTTLAPPPAEVTRTGEITTNVSIFADLMPDEVLATRRLRELKRKIAIGLVGLVVVLVAAYAFSWLQTVSSRSDLSDEQHRAQTQTKTMQIYKPLMDAQQQSSAIVSQLNTLMQNDLSWQTLIADLHRVAPPGLTFETITGSVTAPGPGAPASVGANSLDALNQSGLQAVGTITVTGNAKDKNSVAQFADRLTTIKGIAAPFVSSVTGAKGEITFTVNGLITTNALGGRYSTHATTTTGGK